MNNFIFKVVAAAIIIPVVTAATHKSDQKALDLYQVTEVQKPVARSCRSAMSRYEVKFSGGAKKNKACACIAKYAASQVSPAEFKGYSALLDVKLANGKRILKDKKKAKTVELLTVYYKDIITVQDKYKFSDKRFEAIIIGTSTAMSACGDSQTHKGQPLANITAMPEYKAGIKYKSRKNTELFKSPTPPKLRKTANQR